MHFVVIFHKGLEDISGFDNEIRYLQNFVRKTRLTTFMSSEARKVMDGQTDILSYEQMFNGYKKEEEKKKR